MEHEVIRKSYTYKGSSHTADVIYFPERSIATITQVDFSEGEGLETQVLKEGMTLQDLVRFFPPTARAEKEGAIINLAQLVRSIIYEAYTKQGEDLEPGNVRNFWYTHLKTIITKILGLGETDSVQSTINKAWGAVINSGIVTYEGMNILGGKESSRVSVVKDSPFSNLIIAVEKADFFDSFNWIPRLFNCTLITAGGQPSRTVARAFIRELGELGVDLDQTFFMCVASDLDPAGYYIQEAFKDQFEAAIDFYGGSGDVQIRRLFVRKDQVSEDLLLSEAMPCRDKAMSASARKSEDTKWEVFCGATQGGLYLPESSVANLSQARIDPGLGVRALLEMNAFGKGVIGDAIIGELLAIIEETGDQSKIMIPELMRVFELMREAAVEDVFNDWHVKILQPLIDRFLSDTQTWEDQIASKHSEDDTRIWDHYRSQADPIEERCDELLEEKDQEARERVPELYEEKEDLQVQIADLETKVDTLEEAIDEECQDLWDQKTELERERDAELEPIVEEKEEAYKLAEELKEFREAQLAQFRAENQTVFNPLEMGLKLDIAKALSPSEVEYYFRDLEELQKFRRHFSRLLSEPDQLLEDQVSCFDQEAPTFREKKLLVKAASRKDKNIENVREAFSQPLLTDMKELVKSHAEGLEFELRENLLEDLGEGDLEEKVQDAMAETEELIDSGDWKEDSEDAEEEEEGEE